MSIEILNIRESVTFDTNIFIKYATNVYNRHQNAMFDFAFNQCNLVLLEYIRAELLRKADDPLLDVPDSAKENIKRMVKHMDLLDIPVLPTDEHGNILLSRMMRDIKDLPILVTAASHQLDYLVTEDNDFLSIQWELPKKGF